jgi:hypothetical protein
VEDPLQHGAGVPTSVGPAAGVILNHRARYPVCGEVRQQQTAQTPSLFEDQIEVVGMLVSGRLTDRQ